MSTSIVPMSDMERMAGAIAKSKLFGMKTPDEAIALMLVAQSEGLHPARAAVEYHIINGRPSLKADAMLARFQAAGGKVEWHTYTDDAVSGTFTHPAGGSIKIEWTFAQAQKAGLTNNPTWKKFPRAMLRSRCISEAVRSIYPGIAVGVYTPEEVSEFEPQERDITPPAQEPAKQVPEAVRAKAMEMLSPRKQVRQAAEKAAAKAAPEKSPPIEGTATVVSDPFPSEAGDLSGVFDPPAAPADPAVVAKVISAFAGIGYDQQQTENEYGKPVKDWTVDDINEVREVFKFLKSQQAQDAI